MAENQHLSKDELKRYARHISLPSFGVEGQKKLQRLPVNSSAIRLTNRCWKTGRGRGFYRDFGLSRHVLREMAHECLLPGVFKASW